MIDSIPSVQFILGKLRKGLPDILSYHSFEHTQLVLDASIEIGRAEGLTNAELRLLAVSAAYHDAGFLDGLDEHEKRSCELVRQDLPNFGFSDEDIAFICEAIMATKIPQSPTSHFAKVLCDADLFYLASDEHPLWRSRLKEELLARGFIQDIDQFFDLELGFLKTHRFHTNYAASKADANKRQIILELTS